MNSKFWKGKKVFVTGAHGFVGKNSIAMAGSGTWARKGIKSSLYSSFFEDG